MEQKRFRPYIIAAVLSLSACTKTVYQPIPASDTQTTGASATSTNGIQNDSIVATSVPGNATAAATANNPTNSTVNGSPNALNTPVVTDNASSIAAAGVNTSQINAIVAEAAGVSSASVHAPAVIGEPGAVVDCNLLLPCRWLGIDEDFTLTVGDVANTGSLGRLSIQYTVNASHDSELLLGNGSIALAPGGKNFNLIQQSLGTGNGIKPQAVLAGENTNGSATYDREATSATLAGWTLTIIDNGLPRTIGFINLPIGTPNTLAVNCADVLPCQWESSREDVTITLVAVGGYTANGRLNVNFNVVTERDMDIVLDAGATAIGVSEEQFDGRTHGLGTQNGFAQVTVNTASGIMLPGNVSFFRTSQPPAALKSLNLVIYEDAPTPRWNPQFINLPTQ